MVNDGGPAFPLCRTEPDGRHDCLHPGIALRDWFAGQALAGGLQAGATGDMEISQEHAMWWYHPNVIAARAYEIADAMLAFSEKSE